MTYNHGDKLNNKYLIIEKLGKGSMGEVYHAEQITLHKEVAIKLMHVHIAENPESLARFKREARATAALEHPHICAVSDFDSTDKGDFYIAMEYLKGESLKKRLAREGTLELHSVFRIMDDLLGALECAHENNVIHRDVKPDNIMLLNRCDRDDYVKLIDFGIAHADPSGSSMNGTLTQAGKIYGTPQYLSPEQVLGESVDTRADLYSCGCTLYEMLVGTPPFEGQNYMILLNKHLSLEPPHLPEFECSHDLDLVIQKLLQKDAANRYESAHDVREYLRAIYHEHFNSDINSLDNLSDKTFQQKDSDLAIYPCQSKAQINAIAATSKTNRKVIVICVALICFMLAVIINMAIQINRLETKLHLAQNTNNTFDIQENVMQENVPNDTPKLPVKEEPQTPDEIFNISMESLHKHANTECIILPNDPFVDDETMKEAANSCQTENYDSSFNSLTNLKDKYKDNEHFLIMYLVDAYALRKYEIVMDTLVQLFEMDQGISCAPIIRDVIYGLVENDQTYEDLRLAFKVMKNSRASAGLAWLILDTPCNEHQLRFNRLLECFDAIDSGGAPDYLVKSVNLWRPFREDGSCDSRFALISKIIMPGLAQNCVEGNEAYNAARCTICYENWKEKTKLMGESNHQIQP